MHLCLTLAAVLAATALTTGCGRSEAGASSSSTTSATSSSEPTAASHASAATIDSPYNKPGYVAEVQDGRLYVVPADSELITAEGVEIPEKKIVTSIGAGPAGMTIRSDSKETTVGYLAAKEGFATDVHDGRVYVVPEGSEFATAEGVEIPEKKIVTSIGTGPMGMTIRSDSKETTKAYLSAKPGFVVDFHDGRLYVVAAGSEFASAEGVEIPEKKIVTSIGAGPMGMTIRSDGKDTTRAYLAAKEGFATKIKNNRVYVVKLDSKNNHDGMVEIPEKEIITKIGAGPMGMTVRSDSVATISAYLAAN
jgi:putative transposon-encoded protein